MLICLREHWSIFGSRWIHHSKWVGLKRAVHPSRAVGNAHSKPQAPILRPPAGATLINGLLLSSGLLIHSFSPSLPPPLFRALRDAGCCPRLRHGTSHASQHRWEPRCILLQELASGAKHGEHPPALLEQRRAGALPWLTCLLSTDPDSLVWCLNVTSLAEMTPLLRILRVSSAT